MSKRMREIKEKARKDALAAGKSPEEAEAAADAAEQSAKSAPRSGTATAVADPKAQVAAENVAKSAGKADRGAGVFNRPPRSGPQFKDGPLATRGGKRGRIVELASKPEGTSVEELMAEFKLPTGGGWTRRNVVDALRILHNSYGYGFSTDEKGRIRILTGKPS